MRRCSFSSHNNFSLFLGSAVSLQCQTPTTSTRSIRTSAQYSPLHSFNSAITNNVNADISFGEFKQLITNPGPLRVVYSEDYLDWYFRAFKQKVAFEQSKQNITSKGLTTRTNNNNNNNSNDSAFEQALFGGGNNQQQLQQQQNNASSSFSTPLKPASSQVRQLGEDLMKKSQDRIDRASIQHGLFDLFERCPQYPQVHIDKASDEHIPMLFEEFIFRNEVSAADVWRRALIARALLLANKKSYPSSFNYIFEELESCVFAKPKGLSPSAAATTSSSTTPEEQQQQQQPHVAQELLDDSSIKKYPTLALARYYEYLVKRYHVQNSVEAHVLLKCHLLPDAETLLFSNPPPEDERDASKIGGGPDWKQAVGLPLPDLDELFAPGNLPLARALLFAEFNCHVNAHDPFTKFPNAQSIVSRPSAAETREEFEKTSHISKYQHRRHHVLPTIVQYTLSAIDTRMREVNRIARQNEDSDRQWAASPKTLIERSEKGDGTIGTANFSHRAVRAELRDFVNRRLVSGLKQYKNARQFTERPTLLMGEEMARFRTDGKEESESLSLVSAEKVGFLKVSLPRFVAQVENDRHVSLILSLLGSTSTSSSSNNSPQIATGNQLAGRVQKLVLDHARQLIRLAQEYHKDENRQIQLKASKISASLLDASVVDALEYLKKNQQQNMASSSSSSLMILGDTASSILADRYVPFADRALNEFGFPTEAKYADFSRWVHIRDESTNAPPPQNNNNNNNNNNKRQ